VSVFLVDDGTAVAFHDLFHARIVQLVRGHRYGSLSAPVAEEMKVRATDGGRKPRQKRPWGA